VNSTVGTGNQDDILEPRPDAAEHAAPSLRWRLARARLCVLVDARPDAAAFERLFASLLAVGVPMFQIRDKEAPDAVLLDRARRAAILARQAAPAAPAIVTVNDRVAIAAAAGIDGVHVGAEDMPVADVRRMLGPERLIGRTAHDLDEAWAALAAGADHLGVGPAYASATKSFACQAPRDFLRAAAAQGAVPVFAIGGITPERLDELAGLGISRVAVSAAVTNAPDPAAAARAFLRGLERLSPDG
jgi:thiamine-phosphate pyrophosphorylase